MNLFFLAWNVIECAKYHCDAHVVKLILEMAQMLYSAHHVLQPNQDWKSKTVPFKLSHANHPMSIWARTATANYHHMADLGIALCKEYTKRYKKVHATQTQLEWLKQNVPPGLKEETEPTSPPLCMPSYCKVKPNDPIFCYRIYYILNKRDIAKYKNGVAAPKWFTDQTEWNELTKDDQTRILAEKKQQADVAEEKKRKRIQRKEAKEAKEGNGKKNDIEAPSAAQGGSNKRDLVKRKRENQAPAASIPIGLETSMKQRSSRALKKHKTL